MHCEMVVLSYVSLTTVVQISCSIYTMILHTVVWLQVCCTVSGQTAPPREYPRASSIIRLKALCHTIRTDYLLMSLRVPTQQVKTGHGGWLIPCCRIFLRGPIFAVYVDYCLIVKIESHKKSSIVQYIMDVSVCICKKMSPRNIEPHENLLLCGMFTSHIQIHQLRLSL